MKFREGWREAARATLQCEELAERVDDRKEAAELLETKEE